MFEAFLKQNDLAALLKPREARRPFPAGCERERWHALPEDAKRELLDWGREALSGYPVLCATQFMAFVRTGDRQAYEAPYFKRRMNLMGAALAECIQWDGTYLDAVIDGLWLICEESSWVVSAHNGSSHAHQRPASERPLPDIQNPYIDLFAAQTAATLAHVLALLQRRLDAVSPLIARRVRLEIERRVLLPFMTRDDFWWMGFIRSDLNNWTPWIVSNVMDCLLLLLDDRPRLCEGLARALRMLDRYLACVSPDGGCDEGCAYWNMAGGALLDCLESLRLATGGKADFYANPLIRAIGEFPLKVHIAGDWFLNFADCDAKPALDAERVYRYGQRTGNEALMALGAGLNARGGVRPQDTPQMSRVLNALFNPAPRGCMPPPAGMALDDLQLYAFTENGLYAAVKGGHNGESHNHNDVGGFVLYADGQPEIIDLGNMRYTAKTFGPERYTLPNTRSENHNVPMPGGVEQAAGRAYAARDVHYTSNGVTMDIAAAYPLGARLLALTRGLSLSPKGVVLSDAVSFESPLPVTWVFMLRNRPALRPGRADFGALTMRFPPSLQAEATEYPVTDERMRRCFPGSVWRLTLTAAPAALHNVIFNIQRS